MQINRRETWFVDSTVANKEEIKAEIRHMMDTELISIDLIGEQYEIRVSVPVNMPYT